MKALTPGMKVADAVQVLAAQFAAANIDSPRLDARLLIEAAAGMSREQLVLEPDRLLSAEQAAQLGSYVQRRLSLEPVTRILGERSFYGRTFRVTPDTLDPRPETETLVDLALELVREEGWRDVPLNVIDFGTGTGCILLTLLAELGPDATGVGIDTSAAALAVAEDNARRLALETRCRWRQANRLDVVGVDRSAPCLVVSNPPYIPSADIAGLDPQVREHDPHVALDGGPDGLDVVRQIVECSTGLPGTWFAVEFGAGQAEAVTGLLANQCGPVTAARARLAKDLGGHTRCVAWKPQI